VTATGQPKYHDGFLPLMPGFEYVPFNDIDALTAAFSDEVAAVMVEPSRAKAASSRHGRIPAHDPEPLR